MSANELRQEIIQHYAALTGADPAKCSGKNPDMLLNIAAMTVQHQNYLGNMRADALVRLGELEKLVQQAKQIM